MPKFGIATLCVAPSPSRIPAVPPGPCVFAWAEFNLANADPAAPAGVRRRKTSPCRAALPSNRKLSLMEPPYEIRTPRLLLREFTPADLDDVHAYAADLATVRYMDWDPNTLE